MKNCLELDTFSPTLILSMKIMLNSYKSEVNQNPRIKKAEGFGRLHAAEFFSILSVCCSSYH